MVKGLQELCAKSPAAEKQQSLLDSVRNKSAHTKRGLDLFSFYLGFPCILISVPRSFFPFFFGSESTLLGPGSPEYLHPTLALEYMFNLRHPRSLLGSAK